ncbi:excalibur calcium-binding domain-containing protein [Natronoarchaeum rubrum]|uniref:excalibur calcium-binding domain-containing protein n=1 Tax=Natronoarchaeum rubrum TaxID=755311 RepID=UPI00211240B5|nr:excalibur calcium-binding domain-containing protein [Natronoarchaeum rubrum]
MSSDTKQRTARVAAITVVTFVILATVGAGLSPAVLNSDLDADQGVENTAQANTVQDEDEEFPPSTDDVTEPVVDYDKIDLNVTLTNNRSDNESLEYRIVVLGAIQSTNDTASETVSCEDQTCVVNGTLDADDRAAYRLSGAIVSVSPDDDLVGEFNNGSLEGNALEGLGIGAVYSTGEDSDDDGDGDTSVTVDTSASAAASAVATATDGDGDDGNGDNGGAGAEPNGTDNESPTVDGITYDGCSAAEIEGEGDGFSYTATTEYYTDEGLTTNTWSEENATLPQSVAIAVADTDTAVTNAIISAIEVTNSSGMTVAEAANPEYDACREEIDEEWDEYQDSLDYDCDDFETWEEANEVYENSSGEHGLDGDGDGIPCEGLPGAPDNGNGGEDEYNCEDFETWEEANEVYQDSPGEHGLDGDGNGVPCEGLPGAPDDGEDDTTAESDDEDSEDDSSLTNGEEDGESADEDSDGTDDDTGEGDEDTETGDSTDEGEGDEENGDSTDESDANGTDEDDEESSEEDDEASEDDEDNGESNTDDESSEENGGSEEGNGAETDGEMTDDSQSVLVSVGGS